MTFALDYDGTYTADPELWDTFVKLARERGHKFLCVTQRRNTEENREAVKVPGVQVLFTELASKTWFIEQRGLTVDVWIDDDPKALVNGR